MTPTQALKHALELEQERARTLEAVVKALQTEMKAEKAKVTVLQAQLGEVKDAARAALAALDDPQADLVIYCSYDTGEDLICGRLGTRCDDDVVRCDEHAWPRLQELSYAPAIRRLRALAKGEG